MMNGIYITTLNYLNIQNLRHLFVYFQKLGNGLGAAARSQINVHLEQLGKVAKQGGMKSEEGIVIFTTVLV